MSFDVLWISRDEIESLNISMNDVMKAVERGFTALGDKQVEMPAKIGVHPREDCFIHAMPCHVGGAVDRCGVKCVSGYPPNTPKGLPYISGIMLLADPETGLPQAVMDAGWITAWRTGAASGVYAKHFGSPDTRTVAIIGAGVQGRVNLLAMREVFPQLRQVNIFDISEAQLGNFLFEMQPELPGAGFRVCQDIPTAVADADVIITCTPIVESPKRFITRDMIKPEALCISVDYCSAFSEDIMRGAVFVCDNRNQYVWTQEQGTYFQNGYPRAGDIHADMGEICADHKQGVRQGLRGAVLMGIASHDVMTASLIYDLATDRGLGTTVKL
ncbi:ornithine cyclodeaminase family protein [Salidesulfovibrio onnuriiensis]|uniref:ornithine cyclodeaminase family protein n=1 Tax=Salidesulfovibrio onnuriiensis TaxID=2583823 RepID=UPI0011C7175B|nr:ornithine cyclodeaminase family protein [Salidesulfovibrio onnuriiensis]